MEDRIIISIIAILYIVVLWLHYSTTIELRSVEEKNRYCTENQSMTMENQSFQNKNKVAHIVLLLLIIGLSIFGTVFKIKKDSFNTSSAIYIIVAIVAFILLILVNRPIYRTADYSAILTKLQQIFGDTCYFPNPNTTREEKRFDKLDPDLKRSIIDKYTAYKEEQNKESFYIRQDIEDELRRLTDKDNRNEFSKELLKYMNIPYDLKLLQKSYNESISCNQAVSNCSPDGCRKNNTVTIPTSVVYKQVDQPLTFTILIWIQLVVILYYLVHPSYSSNQFTYVAIIIISLLIMLLYYIMVIRNNI